MLNKMMIIPRLLLGMLLASATSSAFAASPAPVHRQSQKDFVAAVSNGSTAPFYVMVTIIDDKTGISRTGCVTAPSLKTAMIMEHGMPQDEMARQKFVDLLLKNPKHEFHFTRREALLDIWFQYTAADVDSMRKQLTKYTDDELRRGFSANGSLHHLYQTSRHNALRDAIACVLVERGLSPRKTDIENGLWVASPGPQGAKRSR